jgi:flagellar basal-body rod protein FlgC
MSKIDFFNSMEVSASGLGAQRTRMNVASSNLANVSTTRGADGGPYKRQDVVLQSIEGEPGTGVHGVKVAGIEQDQAPPRMEYDPGHPDADPRGYVAYPNVNMVEEMVDMITASRAYEAGVTALDTAVSLAERAISIGG